MFLVVLLLKIYISSRQFIPYVLRELKNLFLFFLSHKSSCFLRINKKILGERDDSKLLMFFFCNVFIFMLIIHVFTKVRIVKKKH